MPRKRLKLKIPRLRSGFRRAAQTPRKRLNLLKKMLASTLGFFQEQIVSPRESRGAGRVHG
jgi:hypothetical protein